MICALYGSTHIEMVNHFEQGKVTRYGQCKDCYGKTGEKKITYGEVLKRVEQERFECK